MTSILPVEGMRWMIKMSDKCSCCNEYNIISPCQMFVKRVIGNEMNETLDDIQN
jgi:hypothetical protein